MAQDHVRVEHRDERFEVALTGGGEKCVDDFALAIEVRVGRGPLALYTPAAAALFATRGDSFEIREGRGGPLAEPDDPDAAAYAEGAALPNPGAKLAGPSFEEWLKAA